MNQALDPKHQILNNFKMQISNIINKHIFYVLIFEHWNIRICLGFINSDLGFVMSYELYA